MLRKHSGEVVENNQHEKSILKKEEAVAPGLTNASLNVNIKGYGIRMDIMDNSAPSKEQESCFQRLLTRFHINRSLLQLKISLFLFFGAGAAIAPFLQVYFKQRGLTISQLSIIYIVNPSVQFLGPTVSGLIADKTGQSKPVLLANMALATLFITSMLFIPDINKQDCSAKNIKLNCLINNTLVIEGIGSCVPSSVITQLHNCRHYCTDNTTKILTDIDSLCSYSEGHLCDDRLSNFSNLNFSIVQTVIDKINNSSNCAYDVLAEFPGGYNTSWCQIPQAKHCTLNCVLHFFGNFPISDVCQLKEDNATLVFACSFLVMVLFSTVFSNCYRFMDVTAMSMVKTHNSDFGKQRFWSILSVLLLSPLVGYLVGITTPEGSPKNCAMAFYMFDGLMVLAMISVWKLDVKINPPGEKMWKKSMSLFKKPDVTTFILALIVIGTSWGFTKMFSYLYLDQLEAPSILLGVIPSVNSLVGLPFLLTSNWWLKKLGCINLLLLGLASYVVFCVGYSLLVNPWYALLLEICSIFTYHLLWVAVIRHCHEISPEGLTSTIIALAGGIHYAIGKGSGSLIGGQIMGAFGGRWAYRVIAAICGVTFCVHSCYLLIRRKQRSRTCTLKHAPGLCCSEDPVLPKKSLNS